MSYAEDLAAIGAKLDAALSSPPQPNPEPEPPTVPPLAPAGRLGLSPADLHAVTMVEEFDASDVAVLSPATVPTLRAALASLQPAVVSLDRMPQTIDLGPAVPLVVAAAVPKAVLGEGRTITGSGFAVGTGSAAATVGGTFVASDLTVCRVERWAAQTGDGFQIDNRKGAYLRNVTVHDVGDEAVSFGNWPANQNPGRLVMDRCWLDAGGSDRNLMVWLGPDDPNRWKTSARPRLSAAVYDSVFTGGFRNALVRGTVLVMVGCLVEYADVGPMVGDFPYPAQWSGNTADSFGARCEATNVLFVDVDRPFTYERGQQRLSQIVAYDCFARSNGEVRRVVAPGEPADDRPVSSVPDFGRLRGIAGSSSRRYAARV